MKLLINCIIPFICCFSIFSGAAAANDGNKKCVGSSPCLACKSIEDCKNCKYCKKSKKCGTCKVKTQTSVELKTRHSICDGVLIYGPLGVSFLPLPATAERTKNSFEKTGLVLRGNVAIDTVGEKIRERYRVIFTDERLTSVTDDTIFTDVDVATNYADSVVKELRKLIQSKEDVMVTIGLGGHRTFYLPPIICGFRAVGYVFTVAPNLIDKTALLTREIKVVALPQQ